MFKECGNMKYHLKTTAKEGKMGEICFIDLPSLVFHYKAVSLRVEDGKVYMVISPKEYNQSMTIRPSMRVSGQVLSNVTSIGYLKLRWQVAATRVFIGQEKFPGKMMVEFELTNGDQTYVNVRPLRVWIGSEKKEETMVLEG